MHSAHFNISMPGNFCNEVCTRMKFPTTTAAPIPATAVLPGANSRVERNVPQLTKKFFENCTHFLSQLYRYRVGLEYFHMSNSAPRYRIEPVAAESTFSLAFLQSHVRSTSFHFIPLGPMLIDPYVSLPSRHLTFQPMKASMASS